MGISRIKARRQKGKCKAFVARGLQPGFPGPCQAILLGYPCSRLCFQLRWIEQQGKVLSDSWKKRGGQRSFLLESWALGGRNNLHGVLLNKQGGRKGSYTNTLPWGCVHSRLQRSFRVCCPCTLLLPSLKKKKKIQRFEAVQLPGFTFCGGNIKPYVRKMLQAGVFGTKLVAGMCHHTERCQQGSAARFGYQRVFTPLAAPNYFAAGPQPKTAAQGAIHDFLM